MDIVVPFRLDGAKSRLSPSLDPDERRKFALAMLRDVLASVRKFGEVTILTRSGSELTELMDDGSIEDAGQDAKVIPSDLELNDALNA
ncbi:MAG: 2-phospho-L-lactate guanylyltransferase, partial [Methanothrix sp.]|nr:2-phospho-L-lactate guanylyltransferase [Methanothrix sp.]